MEFKLDLSVGLRLPYSVSTIETIYGKKYVPHTRLNNIDQYNASYDLALNKDGPRYVSYG